MMEYRTLQEVLESALRSDLNEGVFSPGQQLNERELTERYRVSRGPIREVLRSLEAQGLLVRTRSKGARVARLSVIEMCEVYEIRILLESLGARYGAERATREGIERVRKVYESLRETPPDQRIWLERNNEFHCAIYSMGQQSILLDQVRQLMARVEPYTRLFLEERGHLAKIIDEHELIWSAFASGDADACESLTREAPRGVGADYAVAIRCLHFSVSSSDSDAERSPAATEDAKGGGESSLATSGRDKHWTE